MAASSYMADPPTGEERFARKPIGPETNVISVALNIFATLFFGLRVYTRLRLRKTRLRTEDYVCGVAVIVCWSFLAITTCMVSYGGAGKSFWQVTSPEYIVLSKWTVASGIAYNLAAMIAKLSILIFYRALSPENTYHWVINLMMACFILYSIIYVCLSIWGCSPVSAAWDPTAALTAKCIDKGKFYLSATLTNVGMDIIVLLIPLRIIIPLQVPKRQKATLLLLFLTGGLVIAAAVQNSRLTNALWKSSNYTYDTAIELRWLHVETCGCVICASLSTLQPLFATSLGWLWSICTQKSSKDDFDDVPGRRPQDPRSLRSGFRKPTAAFELQSTDAESSSDRKTDNDEIMLWSKGELLTYTESSPSSDKATEDPKADGIQVVRSTQISYSTRS